MSWFKNIINGLILSFAKYPISMILTSALCVLWILLNHYDYDGIYIDNIGAAAIAVGMILPASIATYIYKYNKWSNSIFWIVQIILFILWVVEYIYLNSIWLDNITLYKWIYHVIFIAMSIVSIFVVYYINQKDDKKLRFVDSQIIYSIFISLWFVAAIVLWIAGIFGSLDYLFDVNVNWDYYRDICIFVLTVVWISMFLGNIDDLDDNDMNYRPIIYKFAKYVLLWLLGIYSVIFLAYGVKILITGDWPKWQLVYMTIWYFVLWILANALLYPASKNESWIEYIYNIFYGVSIVILFMWFMAIYIRVADYGVTVNRYFVLLILLFCALFCVYNLVWRDKKIIWLLWSLLIFLTISVLPIIGFEDVSYKNQVNRLDNLMQSSKALWSDGKIMTWYIWTWEIAVDVYDQLWYLSDYYNVDYIKPYIGDSEFASLNDQLSGIKYNFGRAEKARNIIMSWYSYDYYYNKYDYNEECNSIYLYQTQVSRIYDISWYTKYVDISNYDLLSWVSVKDNIINYNDGLKNYQIDLTEYVKSKKNKSCSTININSVDGLLTWSDYKLFIKSLNADIKDDKISIYSVQADLFIK